MGNFASSDNDNKYTENRGFGDEEENAIPLWSTIEVSVRKKCCINDNKLVARHALIHPKILPHAVELQCCCTDCESSGSAKTSDCFRIIRSGTMRQTNDILVFSSSQDELEEGKKPMIPIASDSPLKKATRIQVSLDPQTSIQSYVHRFNSPVLKASKVKEKFFELVTEDKNNLVWVGASHTLDVDLPLEPEYDSFASEPGLKKRRRHQKSDFLVTFLTVKQIVTRIGDIEYHLRSAEIDKNTQIELISDKIQLDEFAAKKIITKEVFLKRVSEVSAGNEEYAAMIYDDILAPRKYNMDLLALKAEIGALFYGPPGTGKSKFAEAVSLAIRGKYLFISGPELKNKYVGETESSIRRLFSKPKEEYENFGQNASLFFLCLDEVDSICPARGLGNEKTHENSMTNQILACTSNIPPNMIIFATTNRPDSVDPAFLRSGRVGMKFAFKKPCPAQRARIILHYMKQVKPPYVFNKSASEMEDMIYRSTAHFSGLVGADIEAVINRQRLRFLNQISAVESKTAGNTTLVVEDFIKMLREEARKKSNQTFYMWNNALERLIEQIQLDWKATAHPKVLHYKVRGSGVPSLVKHLAHILELPITFYSRLISDLKLHSGEQIVYTLSRDTDDALLNLLKMQDKKIILVERRGDNMKECTEIAPPIENKAELRSILDKIDLAFNEDGLANLEFPITFSRVINERSLFSF